MLAHSPIDGTSEFVRYKTTRREAYEALGRAGDIRHLAVE